MMSTNQNNRYVREDGMVGVVITPGFGGGFSTWSRYPEMALDPQVVEWVIKMNRYEHGSEKYNKLHCKISLYVTEKYGASYHGDPLIVSWVPQGTRFIIHEYDGRESIWREDRINWSVA